MRTSFFVELITNGPAFFQSVRAHGTIFTFGVASGFALGGIVVWILNIAYGEFKESRTTKLAARKLLDQSLWPVLFTADELVAKMYPIIEGDFVETAKMPDLDKLDIETHKSYISVLYVFGVFWGRVERLRFEMQTINITRYKEGRRLLSFIQCLESNGLQLIPRSSLRAIGEVVFPPGEPIPLSFRKFSEIIVAEHSVQKWFSELHLLLRRGNHSKQKWRRVRQRLVEYHLIIEVMIRTLDRKRRLNRTRELPINKTSTSTQYDMLKRVFPVFLPFIRNPKKFME